jgi:hypothetical protein
LPELRRRVVLNEGSLFMLASKKNRPLVGSWSLLNAIFGAIAAGAIRAGIAILLNRKA